jgi:predicted DCC family thiol-disulfide oxidoreductase YuxK
MDKKPKKTPSDDGDLAIIYDAECPVCTAYSCSVEIDGGNAANVRRINARSSDDALVQQAKAAGLEGMVVVHQGRLYHGADALNIMARLAPKQGLGNRLNRLAFGNSTFSRLVYPVLRGGRNTLLRLLGRTKIRDIDSKADRNQ